jgi:hypothetical protein
LGRYMETGLLGPGTCGFMSTLSESAINGSRDPPGGG